MEITTMEGYQNFLAMLGDENIGINFHGHAEVDAKFDDEMSKVALAMSPLDVGPQVPHQALPNLDLAMIDDVITSQANGQVVEGMAPMPQYTQENLYPHDEATHPLCDATLFNYPDQPEDIGQMQTVPVQNPSAMISGVIPQDQMLTIDQAQLQDHLRTQPMSVDQSDTVSMDQSEVMDSCSVAEDDPGLQTPASGMQMQTHKNEEPREQRPKVEETPRLPDFSELLIRIRYRSIEVVREQIKNPYGCLVYYGKPWLFQDRTPDFNPAAVQFPDINKAQKSEMTDSQYRFTEQVLKALEKGLFLRCDDHGNVYATRYCRSKIFWYSTEKGHLIDSQVTGIMPKLTFQKLERNEEVMVFDNVLFQKKLVHYLVHKPTFKNEARPLPNKHTIPISPAIFFTFAQSWDPLNSALSSCLVSMVVNPVRARVQRQWGNDDRHESNDLANSNYRLQISNTTSHEMS